MENFNFKYLMSYSLVGVFFIMLLGVAFLIYDSNRPPENTVSASSDTFDGRELDEKTAWQEIYPNTVPMQIGSTSVRASVAANWPERIKGLSGTPYLPDNVVKLFVFDSVGLHSFWMKEMNYSIDIIWLDESGKVVYLVEGAAPESYPAMFVPDTQAKYVIETVDGFVAKNELEVGKKVVLPKF